MAKAKRPPNSPEETLEEVLTIVANAREELVSVERRLETLRADVVNAEEKKKTAATRFADYSLSTIPELRWLKALSTVSASAAHP